MERNEKNPSWYKKKISSDLLAGSRDKKTEDKWRQAPQQPSQVSDGCYTQAKRRKSITLLGEKSHSLSILSKHENN